METSSLAGLIVRFCVCVGETEMSAHSCLPTHFAPGGVGSSCLPRTLHNELQHMQTRQCCGVRKLAQEVTLSVYLLWMPTL